jgi:creatinine amidohydrolase/Fe(II)-dependent formamide hydrolase-like protein
MKCVIFKLVCGIAAGVFSVASAIGAPASTAKVLLEDLTTSELRDRVTSGTTTVLVPIGGTEQTGPHVVLGKHNVRVKFLAERIAERLGNAVVAPVLAYVPEGSITPPASHMRFSGTISISEATFESILESTAKSFRQHGFHDIVFLGDHGGYQKSILRAAEKINKAWGGDTTFRAYDLTAYYEASQGPFTQVLRGKGFSATEIGSHGGLSDTSLAWAVDPSLVRADKLVDAAKNSPNNGVSGDPRRSTGELGQLGIDMIVDKSVQAILQAIQQRSTH